MEKSKKLKFSTLLKCNNKLDRISELPDGIRELILSKLTLKEAVRTSLLSHRWKTCWMCSQDFNFDASDLMLLIARSFRNLSFDDPDRQREEMEMEMIIKLIEEKQMWYVDAVNRALSFIKSPTIQSIRFSFGLANHFGHHIDSWIKFALDKKTHCLELSLATSVSLPQLDSSQYTFPGNLLPHTNIRLLRAVNFKFVQVTDEIFHHFLSDCPFLETLCIKGSRYLVNPTVAGPSLALKYLEISHCIRVKSIHVAAPALSSFTYYGRQTASIDIKSAPLLTELCIGNNCHHIFKQLLQCSPYFSGLKSLSLDFGRWVFCALAGNVPIFENLRHLEIHGQPIRDFSLIDYISFVERCPNIYSFKVKKISLKSYNSSERKFRTNHYHASSLERLKVFEYGGFIGGTTDLEIVTYLLQLSVFLEKLIIHIPKPYDLYTTVRSTEDLTEIDQELARDRALQIKLPRGTHLVLL